MTTAGRNSLGNEVIPLQRTSVPYTLMETFQTISPKLEKVNATPLQKTMVQLDTALEENPGALRRNLKLAESMLTNLQQRQDQFGAMLHMAAEYADTLNANGDVLTQLATNLSGVISEFMVIGPRLNDVLDHLASLLERVKSLAVFYQDDISPLVEQLDTIGREFGPLLERYTPMIDQGRDLITRLEGMVQPDGAIVLDNGQMILSSNYCFPMPGVTC